MAKAPVHARTHSDEGNPIIWQLTPDKLQSAQDG
jgi:hypothetical protein